MKNMWTNQWEIFKQTHPEYSEQIKSVEEYNMEFEVYTSMLDGMSFEEALLDWDLL